MILICLMCNKCGAKMPEMMPYGREAILMLRNNAKKIAGWEHVLNSGKDICPFCIKRERKKAK